MSSNASEGAESDALPAAARVTEIRVYPVKSMRGLAVRQAVVEPWGLAGDRRWAVVDEHGDKLTGRLSPALLGVSARSAPDGGLVLAAAGLPPLEVARPAANGPAAEDPAAEDVVPVRLSRLDWALGAAPAAHRWLSRLLGKPARLVWLDDPTRRTVSAEHGGRPGDSLSLADAGPVLLTSVPSLRRIEDWVAATAAERGEPVPEPLAMTRFRPNVVIDGGEPFVEDSWCELRIGSVGFRVAEPCDRCVVTTIDPDSLAAGKEPLRSLARHRRWAGKVWFGVRLVPEGIGVIRVGDPVRPTAGSG